MPARWLRYDVIVLDEGGYVPLAGVGAEFLFQVIAERAERATLIVTTNLPFSEWTQVSPNPRLCQALLDRMIDRKCVKQPSGGRIKLSPRASTSFMKQYSNSDRKADL